MPIGQSYGIISINGKHYNIAPVQDSYKVTEVPAHGDIDQKMERRVIYRSFSGGIQKKREEPSMDATATSSPQFSFIRQNKIGNGIFWGNGCDTRSEDRIFCQRLSTLSNFIDPAQQPFLLGDASVFSWAVAQNTIYALQSAPGTWLTSASTIPTITDAVQYGGFLYVAVGDANSFYTWDQTNAISNWAQRTFQAGHFVVIRNQLWRSVNASVFSTVNTDPSNQVWSTASVIGDPNTNITALDVWQDFIMIFKQDGIYNMDKTGAVYPLFPGFKNLGTNPRPLGQWRNAYYFAADGGLIWEVDKGSVKRIGFDLAEPYPMGSIQSPPTPPQFALPNAATRGVPLTNYMIVGFNSLALASGSTTNIGAYFLAWDGNAWHPYSFFPQSNALAVGQTGGNTNPVNPVLQLVVNNTIDNKNRIYYHTQPLLDPFIAASFDTTPQVLYLCGDNGALEDEYKVLERVNIWLDNHTSGTCRIAYALDEQIATFQFTDMGQPQGDGTQGSQQFSPPQPFPTYRKIQLRVTLQTNTTSSSPALRYVILHYKQRTPQRRVWDIKLLADRNIISSTGAVDIRSGDQIVKDLDTSRQNHRQVEYFDIRKHRNTVYIDEIGEDLANLKGDQGPSFIVSVKMIEAADEQIVNTQKT